MMKARKVLLALASVALLTPVAHAQTITTRVDDLILGFRATGGTGSGINLEVDLGNMSQFYNAAPGSTFTLPRLVLQDLVNAYGASWATRNDLLWGAVATTGRSNGSSTTGLSGGVDGHAPVSTLWATSTSATSPWTPASLPDGHATASQDIEGMIKSPAGGGKIYGATATGTGGQNYTASIDATAAGSWSLQGKVGTGVGVNFDFFNPYIEGVVGSEKVLHLYEVVPGAAASHDLGRLTLDASSGLSFQAIPEPSTGVLVALGLGMSFVLNRRRKAAQA